MDSSLWKIVVVEMSFLGGKLDLEGEGYTHIYTSYPETEGSCEQQANNDSEEDYDAMREG